MGGGSAGPGARTSWSFADFDSNSCPIGDYDYLSSIEPSKVNLEKAHNMSDAGIIFEIDCIMRQHTDKLLQAIHGISAHLLQLESRTRQLELSVDDLKVSVGNNPGSTDEKMNQTANILLEVQSCIQDLKCKQEVINALVQPKKLPLANPAQETQTIAQTNHAQQTTPVPHQLNQQFSFACPQPIPVTVTPSCPPPPQQRLHQSIQLPTQYPLTPLPAAPPAEQGEVPSQQFFLPPAQQEEVPSQQFLLPPAQQEEVPSQQFLLPPAQQQAQSLLPPSGIVEHQFFQLNPPSLYPHQQAVAADNSPFQPPMAHHPQEAHITSQTYPPSFQQFYGLYDSPSEPYSYSGSSSHYGNGPAGKYNSPHSFGTGGNNHHHPQIQTASAVSGGTGPAGSEKRVPIDDVVDRVARMGFPREGVRGTVRKMTENGQAVDLNVVLDNLMNVGEVQPSRAWSGR